MPLVAANICITLLTLAAFALSAAGLLHVRRSAATAARRLKRERVTRSRLLMQLERDLDAASTPSEALAANERWRGGHALAGIEPPTYQSVEDGREALAERTVFELNEGSRADLVLVGLGLLCGLAASLWSIWLPESHG